MKKRIILAGNGPYENRGCEAITRGTVEILNNTFDNPSYIANTFFTSKDQFTNQKLNEYNSSIIHTNTFKVKNRFSQEWLIRQYTKYFNPKELSYLTYKEIKRYLNDSAAVLSIGGDNYTLDYGKPDQFIKLDNMCLQENKPIILWGASIGPFSQDKSYENFMKKHLQKITAIFARETHTIKYLESLGIKDNVYEMADPAFVMRPIEPSKNNIKFDNKQNCLGINFSPLMSKYVNLNLDGWILLASEIVKKLSYSFDYIYLIPHVTTPQSNDFYLLKKIYENLNMPDQVILIPPYYNASETKWIISQMTVFAGARTHSTIAALSSGVPTISFAYSTKARGLNQDIYGHLDYCIEPNNLNPHNVYELTIDLLNKRQNTSEYLSEKVTNLKKSAFEAGKSLQNIIL